MKFSEKLQFLRKERNMSQEQLADMLDVSRQSVSKWESGQTYPEMDKLISICSIFSCTLDDLTNDEVKEIGSNKKNKNGMSNIIDEALDIIRKSIDMFKSMSFKSIVACIIEMLIVIFILLIFNLPVSYIYNLGNKIFMNFGSNIGNVLSSIWNFILQASYMILAIIIFIYIYKIRFLDKFDYNHIDKDDLVVENNSNNISAKHQRQNKVNNKDNSYSIFNTLGKIAILFIKFIIICISIPFIFALFMLAAAFIISIVLNFKGVLYLGPILMIISGGVFDYLLLELVFNFIFNKESNKKRIFIMFISSIVGLGIGFGISAIEVANTKFINSVPSSIKESHFTKEYDMKNNLFIRDDWNINLEYIVDETLSDKVKMEITYYKDYSDVMISGIYEDGSLTIHRYDNNHGIYNNIFSLIIDNLSDKTIYNYKKLYNVKVSVYSSSNNINTIKENLINYNKSIQEQERINEIDYYNNQINEYQRIVDEKDNKIYELENNNMELEGQIEEYRNKIEEFKNSLE